MRSGGLVTLHPRHLVGGRVAAVFCKDHNLLVAASLTVAVSLSLANLHLPPSLHPDTQRSIYVVVALSHSPPGVKVVVSKLNNTLHPASTWTTKELHHPGY